MTSKISFSKLTFDEFRKFTWLFAIQLLAFGLLLPGRVLMQLSSHANSVKHYNLEPAFQEIFCQIAGLGKVENLTAVLFAGSFCALTVFAYVHSSVKLDFWHSLPIRRERLFGIKYLAGILTFTVAYVLCQLLTIIIGMSYGAVNKQILFEVCVAAIQDILSFLCSFSGTLVAIMLTGKVLTAVFAVIVMIGYVPIIMYMIIALQEVFFPNVMSSLQMEGMEKLLYTSPWTFCYEIYMRDAGTALTGPGAVMPDAGWLCQLLTVSVIFTAAAVFLYRIRRSEAAGSALAFRKTEALIKILLAVPGTIFATLISNMFSDSTLVTILFLILSDMIFCMIMEFIYRWDIHQILKKKRHMVFTFAVSAAIFVFCYFDVAGINNYLPEKEQIASMAMEEDSYRYYGYSLVDEKTYTMKKRLKKLETDQIDVLYKVAENGVKNSSRLFSEDQIGVSVNLKYHLKNGREIYRSYIVDQEIYLAAMDQLLEADSYREIYYPICQWTKDQMTYVNGYCWLSVDIVQNMLKEFTDSGEVSLVTVSGINTVYFTKNQIWDIVQAYQRNLKQLSYHELYYMNGEVGFYYAKEDTYYNLGYYSIDEKFTETMKLLKDIWLEEAKNYEATYE